MIDDYLAEECSLGRVLGSSRQELFPRVHTNRSEVIKGTSGRWHLMDMSYPDGASVNDGMDWAICSRHMWG